VTVDPFAPLGRFVDYRDQKCGYSPGDSEATDCPADATWHIMWNADRDTGMACDPHMATVRARFVFVGAHPIGPDCGMPGALWDFDDNRCVYPDEPAAESTEIATPLHAQEPA
jgi:hypothetical protein